MVTHTFFGTVSIALFQIFWLACIAVGVYVLILVIKALRKYTGSKEVREEKRAAIKSLGDLLKEHRMRCQMTQEFVSEALGVSRQAVSKWENGTADPSTSNLLAIADLYGIAPEDLIKAVNTNFSHSKKTDAAQSEAE